METARQRIDLWTLPLVLAVLAFAGCASPGSLRPTVSRQLQDRTGHPLDTAAPAGSLRLPPGVSLDRPLSDGEAVAIALWNNAMFQQLLSELGITQADIIAAGQLTNPTLLVLFPLGPKQLEFTARFPSEVLWLRKRRVAAAEAQAQEVAERMVQGGLDLVRDVQLACADLRMAEGAARLSQDTAGVLKQLAALAESRLRAGDLSELEATTARVAALNAEQDWVRARANIELARGRLGILLGLERDASSLTLASPSPRPARIGRNIEELTVDALANRPDLRAAELAIEAAGKRAGLARQEIYHIAPLLDSNGSGSTFEIGPGVEFALPIFHQNPGGKAVADAQWERTLRRYVVVRQQIRLEVQQARVRAEQALEVLRVWDDQVQPPLEATVQMARRGVEAGDLPPIQALDAERILLAATQNRLLAVADWERARAELERAIAHRLDLVPDRTKSSPVVTP